MGREAIAVAVNAGAWRFGVVHHAEMRNVI